MVIIGGGDTGVLVAVRLARRFDVTIIATRPALVSGQELGTRLADLPRWRRSYLVPFRRFRRLDRVRVVHGRATGVDLDGQQVHVLRADGAAVTGPYDALVIASGTTNGFWRHDRVQDLDAVDAELAAVAEAVDAAGTIAVIGGGATGTGVAANVARRHPDKAVHLFISGDEPLPGYHPEVRRWVVGELARAGVQLHPGHRAVATDGVGADGLTPGPVTWSTGQPPFPADAVLWAVGRVRPHTGFLPPALLDDDGFVRVDQHLQVPGLPNVFAVGDVAASDPHRSSARNWGYLVVATNVRAALRGRRPRWRYSAPTHRWGSVLGVGDDGMVVVQPDGRRFRVPRWAAEPLLLRGWLHTILLGGLRRDRAPWRSEDDPG